MTDTYVVFDFEMPSSRSGKISAVGITVLSGGAVTDTFYSLVNPECEFEEYIIELTGITPEAVKDAPTFDRIWPILRQYFEKGILVAHAAEGDLHVLSECLSFYHIAWQSKIGYLCTVRACRRVFPHLTHFGLDSLCKELNVELQHHHAASDSYAAAQILRQCIQNGYEPNNDIRYYDLEHAKKQKQQKEKKAICQIERQLKLLSRQSFIATQKRLYPTAAQGRFMGIPVPQLHQYAGSIAKTTQSLTYLKALPHRYFEEDVLHTFLLNYVHDFDFCLQNITEFLPLIREPAILNLLHPHAFREHKQKIKEQLVLWADSKNTNEAVFALYMLTELFTEQDFDSEICRRLFTCTFLSSAHKKAAVSFVIKAAVFRFDEVLPILLSADTENGLSDAVKTDCIKSKLLNERQKEQIQQKESIKT